jgi:hypothetical protein
MSNVFYKGWRWIKLLLLPHGQITACKYALFHNTPNVTFKMTPRPPFLGFLGSKYVEFPAHSAVVP